MLKKYFTFDAYVCSIDVSFHDFSRLLESEGFKFKPVNAMYGYDFAFMFQDKDENKILVMFGEKFSDLYVSCMGQKSNLVFQLSRQFAGRLHRADVKIDFDDVDAFDLLVPTFIDIAKKKNLKLSQVGDWSLGRDGRTLYVGSRSSVYMIRLYEKFKQSDLYDDVASGRVRLELEIKPDKPDQKKSAFLLDCIELLETSKTYAPIFKTFISDYKEKISLTSPRKLTSLEVTVKHLHRQYDKTFTELIELVDGDLSKFYEILRSGEINV